MITPLCCCAPNTCEVWPTCRATATPCDGTLPYVAPGYVTIGAPVGPLKFDGPYWPAWHNSVVAVNTAGATVSIKVSAFRRTVVQESFGKPVCTTIPTPGGGADCFPTTVATGGAQCGRTVYVDAFSWNAAGTVRLAGGSKDQGPCVHTHSTTGEKFPGIPPGPYPFALTDCTRSGLTPNNVIASTADPAWWPGENRRIAPRFAGSLAVSATATPSNEFPQIAGAGTVSTVVRCPASTASTQATCIDMPITIVPGHQTVITTDDINRCGTTNACEAGTPTSPYVCNVESPENGAMQAAWAIDVRNDALLAGLNAMGISSTVAIGELAKVWLVTTTAGKVRFLFGVSSRLATGSTLRWPDGVTRQEVQSVSMSAPGSSLTVTVEIAITPKAWCQYVPACGCVQSHCENGPGSINVAMSWRTIGCGGSGGCGDRHVGASYNLALGDYIIPTFHFPAICGASATPGCMQYPVTSACTPLFPTIRPDFVGAVPVERAHAGWVKYRNRYDHWHCINVLAAGTTGCCAAAINLGGAAVENLCASACTKMTQQFVSTHQPCAGEDNDCANNLIVGQTTAAGCHKVEYVSGNQRIGALPDSVECMPCKPSWFECGPMLFNASCGSALYTDCDCCNTQLSTSLPELFIVDYDPRVSCSPLGTWKLYASSIATYCDRAAWIEIGLAVVS